MKPQAGQDQLSRFIARLPADAITEVDANAPLAIIETALTLDREQEDDLTDFLMNRFEQLESELGRNLVSNSVGIDWYRDSGDAPKVAAKSFLGKRQLYEMVYRNQVEWRATLLGGLYEEHNVCIPAARRVVQQQIARADNYFFGSQPWVTVFPVGTEDVDLADRIDKWVKHRLNLAGTIEAHKTANEGAFIRGEDVIKTVHRKEVDYHETIANILINPDGAPFIAQDNDYVFEDDVWILDAQIGKMVLKRDFKTVMPPHAAMPDGSPNPDAFRVMKVPRAFVKYDSSESKVVYYMDILIPLDAPSVDEADCVCHTYDMPAVDIATMLMEWASQTDDPGRLPKVLEVLNSLSDNSAERSARSDLPRPEEGEGSLDAFSGGAERSEPIVSLGEFYLYYDPFGDGRGQRNIVVLMDLKNRVPLFYDYLANVTPDCKRPFHVTRINPVVNRWHGSGNMEAYWPIQEMIDLLANRWSECLSSSNRVDFWNPTAVYEGDDNPHLELGGGTAYTLKPGRRVQDALQSVYLNDLKSDRIHEQIQFFQQHLMNMSGVSNANDSRSAGLDTSQLATGINNIQQSGEELFAPWLSHLAVGHKAAVRAAIMLEIKAMKSQAFFHFYNGDQRMMGTISRTELRDIELDIRIEMTRHRIERELVQSEKAYAVFHRYYSLPMVLQTLWARQTRRTLGNLEVQEPEETIKEGYFSYMDNMGLPPAPPTDTVSQGLGTHSAGL